MQKDFLHVLPVEEVISRLLDVSPLPQESKRLDKLSGGPILAETIMATETLPPANRSGMDGYAVQASDLFGASEANPVWLDCVGEIAIDRPPNFTLQSGQCAAIVTGGYLPEGADAVIMVEHTKPFGAGVIEMRRSVAPGEYVMQKGDDAQEGTPLLERGTKLRAQEIGLLAALGITEVPVIRRPRVSILSTGDELVSPEQNPRPGQYPRRQHTRPFSHAPSGCRCLHIRHRAGSARTADGIPQSCPGRRKRPSGGCRLPVRRKLHRRPGSDAGSPAILGRHGNPLPRRCAQSGQTVDIGPLRPDTRLGASWAGSLRAGRHVHSGGSLSPPPCRAFPHGPVFWAGEFPIRTRIRSDILAFAPGHTVAQHRFPPRTRRLYPREVGTSGERPSARRPGLRPVGAPSDVAGFGRAGAHFRTDRRP